MTTFGATTDEDPLTEDELLALSRVERATVAGLATEMNVLRQKLQNCYEKLDRMTRLYQQMDLEFRDFKQQRAIELAHFVGGGPTARGTDD